MHTRNREVTLIHQCRMPGLGGLKTRLPPTLQCLASPRALTMPPQGLILKHGWMHGHTEVVKVLLASEVICPFID